jgi:hypothetical protein
MDGKEDDNSRWRMDEEVRLPLAKRATGREMKKKRIGSKNECRCW